MEELFDGLHRILPTKVTPSKYISLFAKRPSGNLLFSCLGGHSSFEASFAEIDALGGVAWHLLGDMHFAAHTTMTWMLTSACRPGAARSKRRTSSAR